MKDRTDKIKPVFITGIYRSGTTLVSQMLNNHPDLSVTFDSVHFMRFSYGKYNPIGEEASYSALVNEISSRIFKRWKMKLDSASVIENIKRFVNAEYADVYDAVMEELLLKGAGKHRWGEKTNVCWSQIPNFLKMFPSGKAVHIIRDPRDVLSSFKHMTDEPGLRYLDAAFASLHSLDSADEYRKKLDKRNYYCLKYEDLVGAPEKETKRLCGFLEVEFHPAMFDCGKFRDKAGQSWNGDSSFDSSISSISARPAGRWKEKLDKVEVFFTEMISCREMARFGYEPEAAMLNREEWERLFSILNDPFIKERFRHWLKTGSGAEAYPSDPLLRAGRVMVDKT